MARKYLFTIMTVGFILTNVFLKFVSTAAINTTNFQQQNAASNFKNLGPSDLINFNNDKDSSSSIVNSNTDNGTTQSTPPRGILGRATGPLSGNDTGNAARDATGVGKGEIMALSDDVITDALFTNIDTLQDHVEICEEELRQKLKLYSYHQLFIESAGDAVNKNTQDEKPEMANDDSDDNANVPDLDIDDERYDDIVANDEPQQLSQKDAHQTRKRRFALVAENDRPLRKYDIIARKVVERLSARMSYLRSSLVQCHILVRQFG